MQTSDKKLYLNMPDAAQQPKALAGKTDNKKMTAFSETHCLPFFVTSLNSSHGGTERDYVHFVRERADHRHFCRHKIANEQTGIRASYHKYIT